MLTFRRVAPGHYRATAPSGAIYECIQMDGAWSVHRTPAGADPLLDMNQVGGGTFPTYGAARNAANEHAESVGDNTTTEQDLEASVAQLTPEHPAVTEAFAVLDEAFAEVQQRAPVAASLDDMDEAEAAAPTTDAPEVESTQLTEADRPELASLLPEQRPEGRAVNVALARIQPDARVAAYDDLLESVRTLGVFQPVALIETGDRERPFRIADGRRRVAAARAAGLDFIPALAFPADTPQHVAASMALVANVTRRPNPISELEQIETMMGAGADEAMIARELHVPMSVLRRRMRLQNLIPEFRTAMLANAISVTICQDIARHTHDEQRTILGIFEENGRVTPADLRRIRDARGGQTTIEELAAADLAAAADDAIVVAAGGEGWSAVVVALEAAERAVPAAADDTTDAFFADLNNLLQRVRRLAAA